MSRPARITLPPLTSDQALAVVAFLERTLDAIWRTHGDGMIDRLAILGADATALPNEISSTRKWSDDMPF